MSRWRVARLSCAAVALVVSPAWAQVPATAVGLGYPVAPVDGRAAALGSTGIGLLFGTYSMRNPADLSDHRRPGFGLALLAEDVDIKGGIVPLDTGRQRFTVIRAVVPFGGWTASLGFAGELDQDWNARFTDTLVLSTELINARTAFPDACEKQRLPVVRPCNLALVLVEINRNLSIPT